MVSFDLTPSLAYGRRPGRTLRGRFRRVDPCGLRALLNDDGRSTRKSDGRQLSLMERDGRI